MKTKFEKSEEIATAVQSHYEAFVANSRMQYPTAYQIEARIIDFVNGEIPPFLVYRDKKPWFHKFISSGYGTFTYVICCILGIHSVLEALWCSQVKKLKLKIEKKVF